MLRAATFGLSRVDGATWRVLRALGCFWAAGVVMATSGASILGGASLGSGAVTGQTAFLVLGFCAVVYAEFAAMVVDARVKI